MGWRERFLTRFGPGLLGGSTLRGWLTLLRAQGFAIDPSRLPRVMAVTMNSLRNSVLGAFERRRYGPLLAHVAVPPPVFILGHWRTGTTHLHQLLAQDRRYAFPNTYQVSFPHTFLSTEASDSRLMSFFFPKHRPMDNVEWTLASPQEDEFALCISSFRSPYMAWMFPRRKERFEKYLTFGTVAEHEVVQWRAAFDILLRKLTWKYGRPLVLKSPPHTGRIRLLLEMFPGAKFIHIHRDPYAVFQSSRRTFRLLFDWHGLQRPRLDDLDDWVLRQYQAMYDAFFDERGLIPHGSFHEIRFEDLESDPINQVRNAYEALGLPDFRTAEPALQRYIDSLAGYQKNAFPDLPATLKARIAREWQLGFEEWRYST